MTANTVRYVFAPTDILSQTILDLCSHYFLLRDDEYTDEEDEEEQSLVSSNTAKTYIYPGYPGLIASKEEALARLAVLAKRFPFLQPVYDEIGI
jgi:hypothetical protein